MDGRFVSPTAKAMGHPIPWTLGPLVPLVAANSRANRQDAKSAKDAKNDKNYLSDKPFLASLAHLAPWR